MRGGVIFQVGFWFGALTRLRLIFLDLTRITQPNMMRAGKAPKPGERCLGRRVCCHASMYVARHPVRPT